MRRTIIGLLFLIALVGAGRRAEACAGGGGGNWGAAIAIVGVGGSVGIATAINDVIFLGYDLAMIGKQPTRGMAIAEMVTAIPQLVAGTALAVWGAAGSTNYDSLSIIWGPGVALLALGGTMLAHSAWVLATNRPPPAVDIAPGMVSDGQHQAPGLVLAGRF